MRASRLILENLLFGLASLLVILSIGLVSLGKHRQAARSVSCENNLKNLALALHNYHSAFTEMPMGAGGTSAMIDAQPWQNNDDRLSAFVGLTPFMENQKLWAQIANPKRIGSITFPAMGPSPQYDPNVYTLWKQRPNGLVCPSDPDAQRFPLPSSYVLNYGDGIDQVGTVMPDRQAIGIIGRASKRGLFARKQRMKFRDILDGLSNTLMFSESKMRGDQVAKNVSGLVLNPSLCIKASKDDAGEFWPEGRGAVWADGTLLSSGFQTILPPNSPSCTSDHGDTEGVLSVSSHHGMGGAHVAFSDGHVCFVTNSIEHGDSSSPSVALPRKGTRGAAPPGSKSPYGLWGALGTRASNEVVDRKDASILPPQRHLSRIQKNKLMAKPAQVWTLSNGTHYYSAWQIDLVDQSRVVLLTDSGEQKYVLLSQLQSEDAYRAVAQHLAKMMAARKSLRTWLQDGVKLLDDKQFETFAENFIVDGNSDAKSMGKLIRLERGILIQTFESTLDSLDHPGSVGRAGISETRDGQLSVEIDFRAISQKISGLKLKLKFIDEQWRLIP